MRGCAGRCARADRRALPYNGGRRLRQGVGTLVLLFGCGRVGFDATGDGAPGLRGGEVVPSTGAACGAAVPLVLGDVVPVGLASDGTGYLMAYADGGGQAYVLPLTQAGAAIGAPTLVGQGVGATFFSVDMAWAAPHWGLALSERHPNAGTGSEQVSAAVVDTTGALVAGPTVLHGNDEAHGVIMASNGAWVIAATDYDSDIGELFSSTLDHAGAATRRGFVSGYASHPLDGTEAAGGGVIAYRDASGFTFASPLDSQGVFGTALTASDRSDDYELVTVSGPTTATFVYTNVAALEAWTVEQPASVVIAQLAGTARNMRGVALSATTAIVAYDLTVGAATDLHLVRIKLEATPALIDDVTPLTGIVAETHPRVASVAGEVGVIVRYAGAAGLGVYFIRRC